LLKFSREYETQADLLGAQIMARAGYNPTDLARMFQTIEQQSSRGGPEWLSSHPNPGNRFQRISDEARKLSIAPGRRSNQDAEFSQAQASLRRMAAAPTSAEIARSRDSGNPRNMPNDAPVAGTVERPSTRYRTFNAGRYFSLSVPDNWQEFSDGSSVTFAPNGAYGAHQGQSVFTHGIMAGIIQNASSTDLRAASDQYLSGVLQGNPYLQANRNYQRGRLDGRDAFRRRLQGNSPVTGRREIVDVYTALIGGGQLFYLVQVVPSNDQGQFRNAFDSIVQSVRFTN
jgi:hypothetical protein